VLATVGGEQDRAARFEVIAGVVDAATSARLDKWFVEAEKTGTYNGMRLPEFDKRCGAPRMIEVTKTR
jgi:hypothetical protein